MLSPPPPRLLVRRAVRLSDKACLGGHDVKIFTAARLLVLMVESFLKVPEIKRSDHRRTNAALF